MANEYLKTVLKGLDRGLRGLSKRDKLRYLERYQNGLESGLHNRYPNEFARGFDEMHLRDYFRDEDFLRAVQISEHFQAYRLAVETSKQFGPLETSLAEELLSEIEKRKARFSTIPIRLISNLLAGRKRIIDESVSLESVQYILTRMDHEKNKIRLEEDNCVHTDCVPLVISKFLISNFCYLRGDLYFYAKHQVYSGKRKEKHYFDLEKGKMEVSESSICEVPIKSATFSYVADKEK